MNISSSEQTLLEALWQESPLTVGQIIERIQASSDWHANTIKTMLTRLVKKGALERIKEGKRFFYSPLITKEAIADEEASGLLSRFFDGKMAPLVAHFAKTNKLSVSELDEIESILKELKKTND